MNQEIAFMFMASHRKYLRIENGYNPNYIVLWERYMPIINHWNKGTLNSTSIPIKFLGLHIIWTQVPDTVEVY